MAVFHDVLFPEQISLGAQGGPEFLTSVITTGSGSEYRNRMWSTPRGRWTVGHTVKEKAEMDELHTFFRERFGKAFPFRFKDWMDYQVVNSGIGVADGSTSYKLSKTYGSSTYAVVRRIMLPVDHAVYTDADAIKVYKGGVLQTTGYTIDYTNGKLLVPDGFGTGSEVISWTGEFHVPARFDTDWFNPSLIEADTVDWVDIPIIELRPEEFLDPADV